MVNGTTSDDQCVSERDIILQLIPEFRRIVDGWDGRTDGQFNRITRESLLSREPGLRDLVDIPDAFTIGSNSIDSIVVREVQEWIRANHAEGTPQLVSLSKFEAQRQEDGSYAIMPPRDLINRIKRDLVTERARSMA